MSDLQFLLTMLITGLKMIILKKYNNFCEGLRSVESFSPRLVRLKCRDSSPRFVLHGTLPHGLGCGRAPLHAFYVFPHVFGSWGKVLYFSSVSSREVLRLRLIF